MAMLTTQEAEHAYSRLTNEPELELILYGATTVSRLPNGQIVVANQQTFDQFDTLDLFRAGYQQEGA